MFAYLNSQKWCKYLEIHANSFEISPLLKLFIDPTGGVGALLDTQAIADSALGCRRRKYKGSIKERDRDGREGRQVGEEIAGGRG